MSRIDELIREMCPDGVKSSKLSEITRLNAGDRVTKAAMSQGGKYPVYGAGAVPTGWFDEWNHHSGLIFSRAGAGAGFVNFIDGRFWGTDVCFVAREIPGGPLIKYVFYWMKSNEHELMKKTYGGSLPKLNKRYLWDHPVPVPPLPVQEEIVRTLDTFTELEAELEAGLETELSLRSKQLQEMRDRVYSIARVGIHGQQTLSEVGSLVRGTGLMKSSLRKTGAPAIHYGQIHTKLDVWADDTALFVDEPLFGKLRKAEPGDAIVVTTSEDDDAVGKTIAWMGKEPVAVSGETYIFRHELDPFYLAHFFYSSSFHKQKSRYLTGTKVRRISGKDLEKILIPVRPLPEQKKIGLALNSLHAMLKDIGHRIPTEISARRKQYEYYRDKLLTFEELVA